MSCNCGKGRGYLTECGGFVKSYKQTLMTALVVFAAAYILMIMGCGKSSDISGQPPVAASGDQGQPQTGDVAAVNELQPIDPEYLRECTKDEFSILVDWADDLALAKEAVQASGGRRHDKVVKLAQEAIEKCDAVQFYHTQKPCKKTTRVVTDPDNPTVKVYDAYNIHKRCVEVENYLMQLNLRPDPNQQQSQPLPQQPPVAVDPVQPDEPVVVPGQIGQCTSDEFAKLNSWRAALNTANENLVRLGSQSKWKYDSAAVNATKSATSLCESLISYHQARPCMREKTYTAQSLREQCVTARTYYYNYAQRTESLIVSNARLYLDTSIFANRTKGFRPGFSGVSYGQCVIENMGTSDIFYSGQKALVTEARVYTHPEYKMFVLQTQEGLKLSCYGVEYTSAATSLTEVMRLLNAKLTRLPLFYELN